MAKLFSESNAFIILLIILTIKINIIFSCTHIRITSNNPHLEPLNGDYLLDPTIIADGRPVYISTAVDEDNEPKKIYHFAYSEDTDEESNEELNEEEEEEEREREREREYHGRWIIGENVYSHHGWAFISSWSIDPSDKTMDSFVSTSHYIHENLNDEQINLLKQKLTWHSYYEDEWDLMSEDDDFHVQCESKYTSNHSNWDWLFITTKNVFAYNRSISSINSRTMHGFYYRIDYNVWRKIESNLFLLKENSFFNLYNITTHLNKTLSTNDKTNVLHNEALNNHININQTLLQQLLSLFDIKTTDNLEHIKVYSIIEYNNYTNEQGLPLLQFVNDFPLRLTTMFIDNEKTDEIKSMSSLSNHKWHILDMNILLSSNSSDISNMLLHSSLIDITALHVDENDEQTTIYDVFKNYYKEIKLESFTNTISSTMQSTVLSNNEIKDKLINTANNNDNFPYLMAGLGTGGISGYDENREIITASIANGYRKFDSATIYESEEVIGDILMESDNIIRDELFITTKLWPTDHGYFETYESILNSLNNLRTNYIDLYLIHHPQCNDEWMDCSQTTQKDYIETWEMMQKLHSEGVILSIGVSNFDFDDFNRLIISANTQILPHVVQNYFDIANQDWEYVEYLNNLGVVFEGYATYQGIAQSEERQEFEPHYMEWLEQLSEIANSKTSDTNNTKQVSPSQVLLRWLVESQISIIPRTSSIQHLNENWNFWDFPLTEEDIQTIHIRVAETNPFKEDL